MKSQNIENAIDFITGLVGKRYPANPSLICEVLGIAIKSDRPLEKDGYLICQNGKKIILINSRISNRHRKNFIISHELGHFLLHRSQLYSCDHISATLNQNINTQAQETEANAFASELLIPRTELIKHIPTRSILRSDVFRIAEEFDVSATHAAVQAVMASNAENEILMCYDQGKLKWFTTASRRIYPRMVPQRCPVDLDFAEQEMDITGAWSDLYQGSVHQEKIYTYKSQHLILLSGDCV